MFNMGSAPSLADIAAVTKDGNGDGQGNGNGWWVLISYVQLLFRHLQFQIHMRITGLDATADQLITVAAN